MSRTGFEDELLQVAREVLRISLRAADRIGRLSVTQLRALTVLEDRPSANLGQLADGMGITTSTASRLVDRLVAAGLVARRAAVHTRREVELRLTARGVRILDRYDTERLAALRDCLERLPPADKEAAAAVVHAFAEAGFAPKVGH